MRDAAEASWCPLLSDQDLSRQNLLPWGVMALEIVLRHAGGRMAHERLDLFNGPAGLAEKSPAKAADFMEAGRVGTTYAGRVTRVLKRPGQLLWHDLRMVLSRGCSLV